MALKYQVDLPSEIRSKVHTDLVPVDTGRAVIPLWHENYRY